MITNMTHDKELLSQGLDSIFYNFMPLVTKDLPQQHQMLLTDIVFRLVYTRFMQSVVIACLHYPQLVTIASL